MIEKSKRHFLEIYKSVNDGGRRLQHVENVERQAERILEKYPDADKEVVMASVWLHDIGSFIGDKKEDHAIRSEREARKFMSGENVENDKMEKISHCVRVHRMKDLVPETIEAKIVAVADALSHFSSSIYIRFTTEKGKDVALKKLERDLEKISLLPDVKRGALPLYKAWKSLLEVFPG